MKRNGFTIVELLIVIVVIGILAAITIVAFNGIQDRAESTKIIAQAQAYVKGLKLMEADLGKPTTGSCIAPSSYTTCPYAAAWNTNVPNDATFNSNLATYSGIKVPYMSTKYGPHNPPGLMFYHPDWYGQGRGVLAYSVGPNADCGLSPVVSSDHTTVTAGTKFTIRAATYTLCEIEVFKN